MQKITAIIPCKNEEHHIEEVIASVRWCDEIIVVDSYSTDHTLELAKKLQVRILQREYENSASQKNWAIPQAANEWILLVDADERITPELQKEIQAILALEIIPCDAYWIGRKNFFMGKEIRYSGWQRDKVIRLFKRDTCRYEEKQVHAEITTAGRIGKLRNKLLHYTFRDIFQYLEKWDRYSTWSANDADKKTGNIGLFHFIIKPAFRFCKHYFIDLGILDGYTGLIICSLASKGVFMRYVKLYGMRQAKKK